MKSQPKIAIIGAGPSGITTSYFLNKKGYTNIDIYGDIEDAQPKTLKIEDIYIETTTCYLHPGYNNSIVKLVNEYDLSLKILDKAQIIENENVKDDNFNLSVKEYAGITLFVLTTLLYKFTKHTFLSKYVYSTSFKKYLDNIKLSFLLDTLVFSSGINAQGYGFFDNVTSYHLLNWFRPSIFLITHFSKNNNIKMINEGYGTLYRRMYDSLLAMKNKNKVKKVGAKYIITEDDKYIEYDYIFICCPLNQIDTPLKLNNNYITNSNVFSYSFTSNEKLDNLNNRIYFKENLLNSKEDSCLTLRYNGVTKSGIHSYCTFGYSSKYDNVKLKEIIKEELKINGIKILEDTYFKIYKYNYRFTEDAIKDSIHIDITRKQGIDGIYYLGGLMSHWDVDSIYEHSRYITNKFHTSNTDSIYERCKTKLTMLKNYIFDEW